MLTLWDNTMLVGMEFGVEKAGASNSGAALSYIRPKSLFILSEQVNALDCPQNVL